MTTSSPSTVTDDTISADVHTTLVAEFRSVMAEVLKSAKERECAKVAPYEWALMQKLIGAMEAQEAYSQSIFEGLKEVTAAMRYLLSKAQEFRQRETSGASAAALVRRDEVLRALSEQWDLDSVEKKLQKELDEWLSEFSLSVGCSDD